MLLLSLVPAVLAAPPAPVGQEEVSWGCFGTGDAVGYLLVALMLAMLLFLRVHRVQEQKAKGRAPLSAPRPSPRSLDELGQQLFELIGHGDVAAYRAHFLLGNEIGKALGDGADAYVRGRSPGMFEASLRKIASRVPKGSSFDGAFLVGRDALALRLVTVTGSRPTVIVGTVAQVDGIYRMVHPGFVDPPGASQPPTGGPRRR
jgi:hypothetical protein